MAQKGVKSSIDLSTRLFPFIKKWEGGLSRALTDTASAYPCPDVYDGKYGWHTNKGITWQTFKSLAHLGYSATSKNFFEMPDDIWVKIAKEGYWKPFNLDTINHLPRIQAVIFSWAWGSGLGGAEIRLARWQRDYFKVQDNNITKHEITENFKKYVTPANELKIFNALCDRRLEDFKKMSTWNANGKGWSRRLDAFRLLFS